jgi:hypothetical protein
MKKQKSLSGQARAGIKNPRTQPKEYASQKYLHQIRRKIDVIDFAMQQMRDEILKLDKERERFIDHGLQVSKYIDSGNYHRALEEISERNLSAEPNETPSIERGSERFTQPLIITALSDTDKNEFKKYV